VQTVFETTPASFRQTKADGNFRGNLKHPDKEGDNKFSYNAQVMHTAAFSGLLLKSSNWGLSQKKKNYTCTLRRL
jgi:hypothetical protein